MSKNAKKINLIMHHRGQEFSYWTTSVPGLGERIWIEFGDPGYSTGDGRYVVRHLEHRFSLSGDHTVVLLLADHHGDVAASDADANGGEQA